MSGLRHEIPRLQLSVQFACAENRALLPRNALMRWLRHSLRAGPADTRLLATPHATGEAAQVTLRFVDADEGRALNLAYRGKDYATNVLTFDYQHWPPVADIVLCDPVVAREASEQGKALQEHYAHLVVHGMLHALGWDHEHEFDAQRMESAERDILARLGIADPYAGETSRATDSPHDASHTERNPATSIPPSALPTAKMTNKKSAALVSVPRTAMDSPRDTNGRRNPAHTRKHKAARTDE